MLINEVVNLTGLTKKAISYYEKHELIKSKRNKNGYREYSKEDISLLNEISLYRKLDISIKDIKRIINSNNKKEILNNVIKDKYKKEIEIKIQRVYLNRIISGDLSEESIRNLNEEIIVDEKSSGEFIKRELKRSFPSGLGLYLAHHFSPYLNEPIDTLEKYDAWLKIVGFLDDMPDIKIPKFIELAYENMSEEIQKNIAENTRKEIYNMLNAEGEELEKYKEKLIKNIDMQNDKSILKVMQPFYKFKKNMLEFFNSSGYYDIFIPNMRILSSEYNEYQDNLIKLNDKISKELGIKYDENMRIVREKI
ncbi:MULTISPECIES: MerR family transcriptional regulator [Clostridium]|uniref:MerR family transcriptional regulator n=1 Tax=Clostridium TaxID=1485 RepID=UPI001897719B|nr:MULTISPECIES: MerR family transcriptional regulator [Clostridium]MDI9216643.1 MerR family transcriptional regulator [Clostridium tertium]